MALIHCPECTKEISDKAASCPNCGCPIVILKSDGTVKIKMPQGDPGLWVQSKRCTINDAKTGKLFWEGRMGQVAEFYLPCPTEVVIQVGQTLTNPLNCTLDPKGNAKYTITPDMGVHWKATYNISKVDLIDTN